MAGIYLKGLPCSLVKWHTFFVANTLGALKPIFWYLYISFLSWQFFKTCYLSVDLENRCSGIDLPTVLHVAPHKYSVYIFPTKKEVQNVKTSLFLP